MRARVLPLLLSHAVAVLLASPAAAQGSGPIEVISLMSGADVVPNRVLTGAFGLGTFTLNPDQSTVTFEVQAFNLPSAVTGAHIHVGPPGTGGPVLFDLRATPRQAGDIDLTGTLTTSSLTTQAGLGIRDMTDALQSMIGVATYVDVHTEGNPDGEIRGMLVPSGSESLAVGVRRTLLPRTR